ncbi:MAG: AMP-binding protein [Xenophilus sp.]
MTPITKYFPERFAGDALDVVPLLHAGFQGTDGEDLIVYEGESIGRGRLRGQVARLQQALVDQGLRQGDHVAVMLSNSAEHIALIYALIVSGLVWVPVNTKLRGAGLKYVLEHAAPRLLVAEPEFREVLDAETVGGIATIDLEQLAAQGGAGHELRRIEVDHAATLCIIYTSGTTGAPKGVIFTHRMMRIATEAALIVAGIRAGDRVFLWEPLCHIGGAQMLMVPFLEKAPLHVVRRFSATRFWRQWAAARATHLHYLGGVLDILMQLPEAGQPADAAIRVAWGAGVSASAWAAVRERLHCEIRECYGMTECSSFATLNASGKPGSIGRPLPWIRIELLDENGRPVPTGEIGEIVLSSDLPGVFLPGYLNNPEATGKALREGRLHTGDSARQDADGDYVFVGRRTDSMRVRGENVSAWEVERVFADHPAIQASAAVGVASDVGEQEILLFVQGKPGARLDWVELVAWATPKLAAFQLPRFYRQVEGFDLTPSERIQKHRLARSTEHAWDRKAG